jgi:hypothetical protein
MPLDYGASDRMRDAIRQMRARAINDKVGLVMRWNKRDDICRPRPGIYPQILFLLDRTYSSYFIIALWRINTLLPDLAVQPSRREERWAK